MDYHIVFSPELDISPEDFAAAWNEMPECRKAAEARPSQIQSAQFDSVLLTVALAVAMGAAGSALYDLVKTALMRRGLGKCTEVVEKEQPDGSRLFLVIVTREEK